MNENSLEKVIKDYNNKILKESNRLIFILLLIIDAFLLLFYLINKLEIFSLGGRICDICLLPAIILTGIVSVVPYIFKFNLIRTSRHYIVYLMLLTAFMYFVEPKKLFFFMLIPVIVSTRYSDRKLFKKVAFFQQLLFTLSLILNFVLHKTSPLIQEHHAIINANWDNIVDVIVYQYLTQIISFIIISVSCNNIIEDVQNLYSYILKHIKEKFQIKSQFDTAVSIQEFTLENNFDIDLDLFDIYASTTPAKEFSGDFYDFFTYNNKLYIIIADVADKGLSSAMIMMKVKDYFRILINSGKDLKYAAEFSNKMMCHNNEKNIFVTAFIGCFDPETGVGEYINAGHPFPLLKNKNGEIKIIEDDPEVFLGVFEETEYTVHSIKISKGDTLLLYTDGLTDAVNMDNEFYGIERVISSFNSAEGNSKSTLEKIKTDVEDFTYKADKYDDITLLTLKYGEKELIIPSTNASTKIALDILNTYFNDKKLSSDKINIIDVAIDEILSNIVYNAYPEMAGTTTIRYSFSDNRLKLKFIDNGIPFDPTAADDPVFDEEPKAGGLGIFMAKNISDEMKYERDGNRNMLTVTFSCKE